MNYWEQIVETAKLIEQIRNTVSDEEWSKLTSQTAKDVHALLSEERSPLIINVLQQDKHAHGLRIALATDRTLGLSDYEYEQAWCNVHGDYHIQSWLSNHHHAKPYRYKHSHSIDKYLTKEERNRWDKWCGWCFDFERCMVWNSRGKQVQPTLRDDGRLVVNGQSLSWVMMMEWLARTNPKKAVKLLRHDYQVHHRFPNMLGTIEGNKLENLLLVTVREHYLLDNMQRKARKLLS